MTDAHIIFWIQTTESGYLVCDSSQVLFQVQTELNQGKQNSQQSNLSPLFPKAVEIALQCILV